MWLQNNTKQLQNKQNNKQNNVHLFHILGKINRRIVVRFFNEIKTGMKVLVERVFKGIRNKIVARNNLQQLQKRTERVELPFKKVGWKMEIQEEVREKLFTVIYTTVISHSNKRWRRPTKQIEITILSDFNARWQYKRAI